MTDVAGWVTAAVAAVATAAVTACVGLFVRLRTNETRLAVLEAAEVRNQEVARGLSDLALTSTRIDERLRHLPTHADLQLLHDRTSNNGRDIRALSEKVTEFGALQKGMKEAIDRLQRLEETRDDS